VNAIAITNLTKRYGAQLAVDDLSLAVDAGSVCGLLGPNGAGKSTTFKCLLALDQPTSGTVAVDGAPVAPSTFEYLAYVPETSALLEKYSVGDHLEATRRTYASFDAARAAELAATFKLDSKKRIGKLSKGQRTAVALVLAFAIRPRVLVLDEPASGLDPIFQRAVLDLIIDAAAGGACVLFSSHQIGQVERAADSIAVLKGGKLVLRGEIDDLKGDEKIVEAIFPSDAPSPNGLASDPRVRRIERAGRILRLHVRSDAAGVAHELASFEPRTVDVLDLGLEDIFLGAVSDDAAYSSAKDRA
jgi:ABC-2 type transport system ATP-binding protein